MGSLSKYARPILKPRCAHCRRRKIKCDYVQPSCGPCVRAKVPCVYSSRIQFVAPQLTASRPVTNKDVVRKRNIAGHAPLPVLPEVAVQNRHDFLHYFLSTYLPGTASSSRGSELLWFTRLGEARHGFRPLDTALNAVGAMLCARKNKDASMATGAMRLYSQALQELRDFHDNDVSSIHPRWYHALLASNILQIYETFAHVVDARWHPHIKGITSLLRAGGVERIRDPNFRSLFYFCRASIIVRSILGGIQHMADAQWVTQPWGTVFHDKMQEFMDLLSGMPHYIALAERLCHSDADALRTNGELRSDFRHLHRRLEAELISYNTPTSTTTNTSTYTIETTSDPALALFGYEITYPTLLDCQIVCWSWGARLLLFEHWTRVRMHTQQVERASQLDPSTGASSQEGVALPNYEEDRELQRGLVDAATCADHISCSVRTLLGDGSGVTGVQYAILSVRTAYAFYDKHGYSEKRDWLHSMVGEAMGYRRSMLPWLIPQ